MNNSGVAQENTRQITEAGATSELTPKDELSYIDFIKRKLEDSVKTDTDLKSILEKTSLDLDDFKFLTNYMSNKNGQVNIQNKPKVLVIMLPGKPPVIVKAKEVDDFESAKNLAFNNCKQDLYVYFTQSYVQRSSASVI